MKDITEQAVLTFIDHNTLSNDQLELKTFMRTHGRALALITLMLNSYRDEAFELGEECGYEHGKADGLDTGYIDGFDDARKRYAIDED